MRVVCCAALALAANAFAAPRNASAVVSRATVAAENQVSVQADVVFASTAPGKVEPELAAMQATLEKSAKGTVKYLTMKKLSANKVVLPATVTLPNQKTAELKLETLKDGVATLRVKVAPTEATYKLAREKSFYLQAGQHDGGDVWLVLSQPK